MDVPQPHKDLWFSDGSVVLKTESYLFRVHKSILARESTVFDDMFGFPVKGEHVVESVDDPDEYEGLPLVPLIGDDETAVVHLLMMIYKPNYSLVREPLLKLPYAVSLFKLSNKYHFSDIEEAFQTELKIAFPQTRAAFGRAQSLGIRHAMFLNNTLLPLLPVIQDTGLAKMFPSLFYCCSQYSIRDIVLAGLPPKMMEVLLAGRESLKQCAHRIFTEKVEYYRTGLACCKSQVKCRSALCFVEFNAMCQYQTETVATNGGDFFTIKDFDEVKTTVVVCDDCKKAVRTIINEIRDKLWNSLSVPELD